MHAMTRIKTGGWPATAMITGLVILFSLVFADSSVRADTIIDNGGAGTSSTGSWGVSGAPNPYGADALWSRDGETYTWRFTPSVSGSYDVSMWWTQWPSRSSSIPVEITSASGTARVIIDQLKNGGIWNRLGTYYFTAGITYAVTIISQPGPTSTCADAVKFTLLNGNYPPDGTIEAPVGDVTIPQGGVVNFSGSGTDPEGAAPLACLWHFGNGSGIADSTVCTPGVVRFDLPGSFVVTFTVSDPSGLPDPTPDQRVITVLSPGDGLYMPDWTSVSESPFAFAEPAGIINPVLTAADVTDAVCDFVADPFMFHADGTWYLFFEAHNIIRQAGEIGLATSADGLHWTYDRIVLSNPWHNSYPLVFGYDGKYYMVPESGSEQAVYLYEASNFPYNWKKVATLISGKAYVDSTIFRYNDAWWLFTTVDNDSPDSNREARLFYSDSLLSGWTEHPKSPFITYDRGTARPGGRTFVYDGRIIRVAQKCDVKYGEKVRAFQVDLLTKTDYAEHEIPESPILSSSGTGWNAGGMHQFDPWWAGDHWLIAVDGNHSLLNTDEWSIGIYTTQNTAPSITSEPVTAGVPGGTYAYDVNASGKPAPLYGLVEPVPEGMTIDPATGLIHWVPQSTGDYAVTVRATNSVGSDTQSFVITVSAYTVIDNGDGRTSFTGDWALSSAPNPYEGASLWSRDNTTFTWNFTPSASGMYDVSMWWTEWSSRSAAIPVDIQYAGGTARVTINQLQNGGKWNLLGTYTFNAGTTYKVTVTSQPGPSSTCADAVKFTPVAGGNMPPVAVIDSILPNPAAAGHAVTFTGHGTDADGGIAGYLWKSNIDGTLSTLPSFSSSTLSVGSHIVAFVVRDDKGADSLPMSWTLTVKEDSNVPPVATIDSITPNPSLPDQTVTFIGHGSDDDGTITEWSWRSSRDGVLGSSASFSTAALTSGIHTIYFKVRDNKGAWSPETPAIISRFGCGAPVKIMPLGDSITHGYDATIGEDQEGLTQGYRGVLFGYLQSAGYSVDFVGSLEAGFSVQPLFDTDHEGHDGFSAEGGPYGDILSNVQGYLSANPADVILLHIGTNDISFGNQDPSEVEAILDEIERCRPNTLVFLARIINRTDGAGLRSSTTAFNDAVEAMALERIKRGDPLVMVNLESALDYLDDMSDALHPNSDGYAKMAAVWRDAVTPYLPACGGGATSVGATFSGRAVLIQDWMKTAPYLNYPGMNRNAARTLLSGLRN